MKIFFNSAIRILLCANWIILIASAMLGPIYAIFVQKVGGDLLTMSAASALYYLVGGIVTLFSGKYSDTLKERKSIVIVGYCIMGIGFFYYLWVNSIVSLFLVQVITGLGEAIYSPAFDALYSKHLDQLNAGQQWGAYESSWYFTVAFGSLCGGCLVTLFGFSTMFVVMGLLCFASAIFLSVWPRGTL